MYRIISPLIILLLLISLKFCCPGSNNLKLYSKIANNNILQSKTDKTIVLEKNVHIEKYFDFLDSIVYKYDSLTPFTLTEHLLVRSNPWIIDTLIHTDYYWMKSKDSFVYNQKKMIALPKGNFITIPNTNMAKALEKSFSKTTIDLNIPEFKLRILVDNVMRYEFSVRVGRNERKYLEMSGRIEDLRTKSGKGKIVKHFRNPQYANPVTNHVYEVTKRDDNNITKLPQIPFIETELNGLRYGQLIHPTTNIVTLGKAYSNGCIGTSEADAWIIYYYAPIGTKITFRYDLNIINKAGDSIRLKDIYNKAK